VGTLKNKRFLLIITAAVYLCIFYFFYIKYVPLVNSFQILLIPVLLSVCLLTAIRFDKGTLLFIFLFPLINSLPYFFSIYEHIPHAPTALVLFLSYFFGWIIYRLIDHPAAPSLHSSSQRHPVFLPLAAFSLIVLFSGLITLFKFSNFFPFLSDSIYELITNVNGVTTGGAIQSTLFHSLNYLTGIGFFLLVIGLLKSQEFMNKIVITLAASGFISILFGFFQHVRDMSFGNPPFWVKMGQINATFKDPNSFGVFLALIFPLVLGGILHYKKWTRIFFICVGLLALLITPQIGTRSGFLGLVIGLFVFFLFVILSSQKLFPNKSKKVAVGAAILVITAISIIGLLGFGQSRLFERLKNNSVSLSDRKNWIDISPERFFLWKEAAAMIKDYPVSGVGVGSYIIELPNFYTKDKESYESSLESFRRSDSAENYFLHVGAEMGFIGLLFILWFFLLVIKGMKTRYKELSGDKDKYLVFGAIAGIISYFVNLLFHSFVGSFEVKYTFWLLVAIVLFSGPKKEGERENPRLLKGLKPTIMVLILLFIGVYSWNSTHSLSLKKRSEEFGLKQQFGLGELEGTDEGRAFRWTGKAAGMTIRIEKPVILIPLLASHPDIKNNPVVVKIYFIKDFFKEQFLLGEIVMTKEEWQIYEFDLFNELDQDVILLFEVSRTWNPLKALGTPDPRNLGVAVGSIQFQFYDKIGPPDA